MNSDYDFYLVAPDDAGNRVDLSQKAYKSLRGSMAEVSIHLEWLPFAKLDLDRAAQLHTGRDKKMCYISSSESKKL